jgi:hypothetical protein
MMEEMKIIIKLPEPLKSEIKVGHHKVQEMIKEPIRERCLKKESLMKSIS